MRSPIESAKVVLKQIELKLTVAQERASRQPKGTILPERRPKRRPSPGTQLPSVSSVIVEVKMGSGLEW